MSIENTLKELQECKGDAQKIVEVLFKYKDEINDENFYNVLLQNLNWWYPQPLPTPPSCYESHFVEKEIKSKKRKKSKQTSWRDCPHCLSWSYEYEDILLKNFAKLCDIKQAELYFSRKNDYPALKEIRKVLKLYDVNFYKKWRRPRLKKREEDEE